MPPIRSCILWLGFGLAIHASPIALAQPATLPHARLWTVTPAGGQIGSTVRVQLAGVDLEDCTELRCSCPNLQFKPVADPANPQAFLPLTFEAQVPADTPPGWYEVWAVGRYGVSNPRTFNLGRLPEAMEQEPNDQPEQSQELAVDSTITGAIHAPVDVDFFKFSGKAGQIVVAAVAAERLDSRLDPELRLLTMDGRMLGQSWRFAGREACVAVTLPADGTYLLRLCQHAHQTGDVHHFYRLTLTSRPYVVAVEDVSSTGATATVLGFNLPAGVPAATTGQTGMPWQRAELPSAWCTAPGPAWSSAIGLERRTWHHPEVVNGVTCTLPLAAQTQPAGPRTREQPDLLTALPAAASGCLSQPGQRHWFRFSGKKDQAIVVEALGDRLGNPQDLFLELVRADNGQSLGEFDDPLEAMVAPRFFARTDDPKARLTLPEDGDYLVALGSRASPMQRLLRQQYRLVVRAPQPDFSLIAVPVHPQSPGAVQLARGSQRTVEVFVQRRDGFSGPIELRGAELPPGVTTAPQILAAGAGATQLVFSVAPDAPPFVGELRIVGAAEIAGQRVERTAEAACHVWPNPGEPGGVPAIARLVAGLQASIREAPPLRVEANLETLAMPVGGTASVPLRILRDTPETQGVPVAIGAVALPPGVVLNKGQPLAAAPGVSALEAPLTLPANLPPGEYTFALAATASLPYGKKPEDKKAAVVVTEAAVPIRLIVFAPPAEKPLAVPPAVPPASTASRGGP